MFGTPYVASHFPAWRAIMDATEAGLFVDPGDPSAIAAAIIRLARNRERHARMGEAGRAFVARYNWETESRKLIAAYEELLAGRAIGRTGLTNARTGRGADPS